MKTKTLNLTFALALTVVLCAAQSQEDIVLKAMHDELKRSMAELQAPGFEKPCFIMYGVRQEQEHVIMATLGSIVKSETHQGRGRSTSRVLVGDYGFNDESLEDDLTTGPSPMDLGVPVDDDYAGIRRSFWSITDNVYREAARKFKKHQDYLRENAKELKDVPHREFARSAAVNIQSPLKPYSMDKPLWESRLRNLSAAFLKHPEVSSSAVVLAFNQGYNYLVSSEGTVAKVPFQLAAFMVIVEGRDPQGLPMYEQLMHVARTPDQLPSETALLSEIEGVIKAINDKTPASSLQEMYTGPVLFLGPSVVNVFERTILSGREGLMATDNIPSTRRRFQFDEETTSMDSKIGRTILHESVTIKAKPRLKTYQGIDLLGSFEIDNEGIVPPEELVLVEKGVLKNLMNNRTITHPSQTANGFGSGPGVVEVTLAFNDTEAALREKLLAHAKKEGLDFAVIVKGSPLMGMGPVAVYKVSVSDGKETLVRNAMINDRNARAAKRILGASGKYAAHNSGGAPQQFGDSGRLTSYIVPTALLLEEVDIQSMRMPFEKESAYVPSPLK